MPVLWRKLLRNKFSRGSRARFHSYCAAALFLCVLAIPALAVLPTYGPAQTQFTLTQFGRPSISAAADFNCDSRTDMVIARGQFNQLFTLNIALANGSGGFIDGTSQIFTGPVPSVVGVTKILIEDFNGDGRPDIYLADTGNAQQNTLVLSTADCHLTNATSNLPQQADYTQSASTADIDGDGDLDLYVGNLFSSGGYPPQIQLNDGTGHFTIAPGRLPAAQTEIFQNRYSASLFLDVNNDGIPDLILGANDFSAQSVVLINDGKGNFSLLPNAMPPKPFATTDICNDIKSTDINHDGYPDMVLAFMKSNQTGRWLQILINNGSGTFADETSARLPQVDNTATADIQVHVVDIDGDGNNDLIAQSSNFNSGHRAFTASNTGVFTSVSFLPSALRDIFAMVDVNGNGHRDFLNISYTGSQDRFSLIPDTGAALPPGIPQGVRATRGVLGHIRLWWPYVWGATSYEIWRSSSTGSVGTLLTTVSNTSFDDTPVAEGTTNYYRIRAVNGAGTSDYSVAARGKSEKPPAKPIEQVLTYGSPQFQFGVNQTGWVSMSAPADFNCDNIPDVVALRLLGGSTNVYPLTIALADGHGGFYDGTNSIYVNTIPLVQHQGKILIEDFNGDGRPDIFTADVGIDGAPYTGRQNTLSLSTPDCRLVDATNNLPQQSDFTHSATVGDIDNDGDVDLYVGNIGFGNMIPPQIWLNDGTGHFTIATGRLPAAQTDFNLNRYTSSLLVDVNNDGNVDLVLGGEDFPTQSVVLLNDGTGHFSVLPNAMPPKPFASNAIALDIQSTDIDHDGFQDLVVVFSKTSYQGRWLQILINNGDGTFSDQTASRLPQVDNNLAWDVFAYFVDFDGDGNNDLVTQSTGSNYDHQFYTASNAGTFTSVPLLPGLLDFAFTWVDAKDDGHRDMLSIGNPNDVDTFTLVPNTGVVLPPGIPQRVRTTRGLPNRIRLWWPYVWGATAYEVWRSSSAGGLGTLVATVSRTSFDDYPQVGATAYYRIRAVNSAGTSDYSVVVGGTSTIGPPISKRKGQLTSE